MTAAGSRLLTRSAIACAALAVALVAAPTAGAANPDCGEEITKDVKLTKNLNCSSTSTDGLIIDDNNITVDLNGHKIIGGGGTESYYGIDNGDGGFDNLTIKDGVIQDFYNALYSYNSSSLSVTNVDAKLDGTNDYYGFNVYNSNGATFKKATVDNATQGFYLNYMNNLKLLNSKVTGSDPNDTSYGVYLYQAKGVVENVQANGASYGFYLSGETPKLKVLDSVANNTGSNGFYISNSTPAFDYNYILQGNRADDGDGYGFYANNDASGGGNRASGNATEDCVNVPCV